MEKTTDNSILVTMNICSLYTNIPNKEGIETGNNLGKKKYRYENYLDICPFGFNTK